MNWTVSARECDIGVCIWFGAPILHRISGLNFAWHWHVVCVHMHLKNQSRSVESGGLLLKLPSLVSMKKHVDLLACSVWTMRCTSYTKYDI